MFKTGVLVGFAVVAVLALSGCASAGASADVAKSAAPEVEVSAPVLTAEPVEATAADDEFLNSLHNIVGLKDATAETAIPVGTDACDQIAAGTSPLEVVPVPNADEATNEQVVIAAVISLCPEFNDATQQVFVERSVARASETAAG